MIKQICFLIFLPFFVSFAMAQDQGKNEPGSPAEVVVTPYKTTMVANGKDESEIKIVIVDSKGTELSAAENPVTIEVTGDATIVAFHSLKKGKESKKNLRKNSKETSCTGACTVILQAGNSAGHIKFTAKSPGLWTGSTDIITVKANQIINTTNDPYLFSKLNIISTAKPEGKILGADISFLPQLEARGIKFSDNGVQKDVFTILKDHGFNYIRLRLFVNPANDSGYSPGKGFCDLPHTMEMAKRIKNAGMKFLLDFHYSDTWADPGKQFKPKAWENLDFKQLAQKVYDYTFDVLQKLKEQGTLPDMVQCGNEINHGILWPTGNVQHLDSLAILLNAGMAAVKKTDPSTITLLHIALGGQNAESEFFIDNMMARGVQFDVIGESYYPKWHGTLEDLKNNLIKLHEKYQKPVIVAEYSQLKKEVNKIAFSIPGNKMEGTFIWEPLNTWEAVFDKNGNANDYLTEYDEISKEYLK